MEKDSKIINIALLSETVLTTKNDNWIKLIKHSLPQLALGHLREEFFYLSLSMPNYEPKIIDRKMRLDSGS